MTKLKPEELEKISKDSDNVAMFGSERWAIKALLSHIEALEDELKTEREEQNDESYLRGIDDGWEHVRMMIRALKRGPK